jgi:ferrochelatase
MTKAQPRVAVVLLNLGGPDGPQAVRPFLENLFSDKAMIGAPWIVRRPLAALIARLRRRSAIANYALMGGGSPILKETRAQAEAVETSLRNRLPGSDVRAFIAMRYWRPFTEQTATAVAAFSPDHIVLTPLYPQYSTTAAGSSLTAWRRVYKGAGETHAICCWPANEGLIGAHAAAIRRTWEAAGRPRLRLLFSAHGLPLRIAQSGDPYQSQVEATCAAIAARLGKGWDWEICYQSRVGPLRWLGPSTPQAIEKAARDGLGVLVDPVAFVSDHIETLVELDIDYAKLARELGARVYLRAPVAGVDPLFIDGLADAIVRALGKRGLCPDGQACGAQAVRCARRELAWEQP